MKTWEELSLPSKTIYVGFTLFYVSLDKLDELIRFTKETYNVFRKERMRKEVMN